MSIQLSDLRLILGRAYLLKCTKTSECWHADFLVRIAELVFAIFIQNCSMAGGQERNLKIEEGLPLGTTKVGVEEKMELKRTRVLKLGLKEIA